jgi:hypothetical protein
MRKMKRNGIKLFIVALASFLMLVFCIVAAAPDSTPLFIDPTLADNTQEQEFTGGVLAINTHRSIYLPNEAAFIGIAVLDNEGHMVCDADVTLTITDPGNNETVLSTGNGSIKVSPGCTVYGVTNLPDFYTNYEVGGVGTYVMNLTAVTADGTKSITDEFSVQNSVDFEVARDGATRIYPPVPYVMNFTIKANRNYTGVIREYVPASFVITPQDGLIVTTVGDTDTKILTWTRKLVKGETYNIYYEFDAPDVSPYLFVLGELEIGDWKETRKWRIAADATRQLWITAYNNTKNEWTKVGTSPYLNAQDQPTSYGNSTVKGATWGDFDFADSAALGTINSVHFYAYGKCAQSAKVTAWGWDGTEWLDFTKFPFSTVWGLASINITSECGTWTKINGVRLYIENEATQDPGSFVDACYILVDYTPPTWVSYSDSGHGTPWGDDQHKYDSANHVVYMGGENFALDYNYKVAYYDADGTKVQTEFTNTSTGTGALLPMTRLLQMRSM